MKSKWQEFLGKVGLPKELINNIDGVFSSINEFIKSNTSIEEPTGPFGIQNSSIINVNIAPFTEDEINMTFPLPEPRLSLEAVGKIRIDKDEYFRWYHLSSGYFIHAHTSKNAKKMDIFDSKLFCLVENKRFKDSDKFLAYIKSKKTPIGKPELLHQGKRFSRYWERGNQITVQPRMLKESVKKKGDEENRTLVKHYCMLYSRQLPESDKKEWLLISASNDQDKGMSLRYYVGVDINERSFEVL